MSQIFNYAKTYQRGYADGAEEEKRKGSIKASKAYQAGIEVGTIEGAAAERERVLKALIAVFEAFEDRKRFAYSADDIIEYIENFGRLESPRSQPEKQQYCKHLKWLTQVEGGGEYRCELGNKTSDEWCYKKERCGDYELVPECGACTGPDPLKQCDGCLLKGLRLCMYHGYPDDTIPPICDYRIVDIDRDEYCIKELRKRGRSQMPNTINDFLDKIIKDLKN